MRTRIEGLLASVALAAFIVAAVAKPAQASVPIPIGVIVPAVISNCQSGGTPTPGLGNGGCTVTGSCSIGTPAVTWQCVKWIGEVEVPGPPAQTIKTCFAGCGIPALGGQE